MKKFLIVVIIVGIVAGAGFLAWSYFSPAGPSPDATLDGSGGDGRPPPAGQKPALGAITSSAVFDYWLNNSGEVYYLAADGRLFRIDSAGKEQNVISQKIPGLISVQPSFEGEYAAVSFGSNLTSPAFSIFNIDELTWQPLPAGITSVAWSPVKNELAYLTDAGSRSSIAIFDLVGKKPREIISLSQKDLSLEWILPDEIYLTQRPSNKFAGSLWSLNIKNKTLRPIIQEEPGLMVNWSPGGKIGLKFINRIAENQTALVDTNNKSLNPDLPVTLPLKCAFGQTLVYCAIPAEIPPGITLPDDYLKRKFYSRDTIISRDTEKNNINVILDGTAETIDAEKLKVQGNKLYFINRYDRKLYTLELEQ